ncbi:MAG: hypothetical protein JWO60_1206 [Frankiales bacterium]|nr:hypothetical protein [Frankiales bacterium]
MVHPGVSRPAHRAVLEGPFVPIVPRELSVRRPSRLTLVAAAAALPLTFLSACSSDDGAVRSENGSGVDGKSSVSGNEDGDQSQTRDQQDEG